MSVAYRTSGQNANSGATSITTVIPAGAVVGDILIAFLTTSGASVTDPGGWTKFASQTDTSYDSRAYWRLCQSGDPGANLSITTAASGVSNALIVAAYSGVDRTSPIHGVNQVAEGAVAQTTHVTPALTTTITSHLVELVGDKQSLATETWTAPAAYTKRNTAAATGSGALSAAIGDINTDAASGAKGGDTWTAGQISAVASMFTVALTPDTTPPASVTNVGESHTQTQVTLTWTNPADADFTGVMVRRAAGATPPNLITDGTLVSDVTAPTATVNDTGLTASTQYSYSLFAHDGIPNYATKATLTVTTAGSTTTGRVGTAFLAELNRLANNGSYPAQSTWLEAAGAANKYAGTTGLEVIGALNAKAGNARGAWKDLAGVANQLAGTTGLGVVEALRRILA